MRERFLLRMVIDAWIGGNSEKDLRETQGSWSRLVLEEVLRGDQKIRDKRSEIRDKEIGADLGGERPIRVR